MTPPTPKELERANVQLNLAIREQWATMDALKLRLAEAEKAMSAALGILLVTQMMNGGDPSYNEVIAMLRAALAPNEPVAIGSGGGKLPPNATALAPKYRPYDGAKEKKP